MSTPSDSYVLHDHSPSTDNDDVDSLPSISSSILGSDDSEYDDESDAQKEWEQSLEQLQLLLNLVLIPFAGKFLGRKFAYWSKTNHTRQILGKTACAVGGDNYDDAERQLLTWPGRLGAVHGVGARSQGRMV